MNEKRRTAINIVVNWAALFSAFVVTYFLSPYVVEHLGTAGYGTWAILVSLTSYMALMDLGMRGAVTRFVARHHAPGDHAAASAAVGAALWFRQWIALAVVVAAVVLASFLETLGITGDLLAEARFALLINAVTVVVVLIGGVFGGVLAAMSRFTTISAAAVTQTALRAAGTIVVLQAGYSLVALALVELGAALVAECLVVVSCLRAYPELRLRVRTPDRTLRNQLSAFSGSIMIVQLFARAAQYGQTLMIGAFFSVAAVTFFAIGQALADSVRQFLLATGPVFMSLASRMDATRQGDSLRLLLGRGTRLTLFLLLPVLVTLFIRGETFIGLWMGAEYASRAGEVLRILVVGMLFQAGTSTAHNILFGMGALRAAIVCTGIEAGATVLLSLALAGPFGLAGVAWGATLPIVVVRSTLWPRYVCRAVGIGYVEYAWSGWVLPLLAVVPFVLLSMLIERNWAAPTMSAFFVQVAVAVLCYLMTSPLFLWADFAHAWSILRPTRFPHPSGKTENAAA